MPQERPQVTVCITGQQGQIGYQIIPQICNGDMFGKDQPVRLHLLDLSFQMESLSGTVMEIEDGEFPLVKGVLQTDDPTKQFSGCDCQVLLGQFPRKQGMERKDLMEKNIGIFKAMGEQVERNQSPDIKVLVVGNPQNTNQLVMSKYQPKVPKKNFTQMTRLDHCRQLGQIQNAQDVNVKDVKNVIIWGNHSSTQFPDVNHGTVGGKPIRGVIQNNEWLNGEFIETIQKRGQQIINQMKKSSQLSAQRQQVQHMNSWWCGTPQGEFVSMQVLSDGNKYGIENGLMYSFPCKCQNGQWQIVEGLTIDEFSRGKMQATEKELVEERELAFSIAK